MLGALDATRASGWLSAESHLRNFGEEARGDLAKMLSDLRVTLDLHPARYFIIAGDGQPLFVWMQSARHDIEWRNVNDKASAAALSLNASTVLGVLTEVGVDGTYHRAQRFAVSVPNLRTTENAHIFDDAERMRQRARAVNLRSTRDAPKTKKTKNPGRNDPCPCGSGLKYKKCHGR